MTLAALRRTSAAIHFDLVDVDKTLLLRVNGEPSDLKRALRAACSHRRSIITSHPNEYFCNVMHQLGKSSIDSVRQYEGKEAYRYERQAHEWNYRLTLEGNRQMPYLHYKSIGKDETHVPLYQFLGTEHKRHYEHTPNRRANPGGRPKEKWLKDALFRKIDMAPKKREWYEKIYASRQTDAKKRQQELDRIDAAANRIPLDIKHKPPSRKNRPTGRRVIPVDFTEIDPVDVAPFRAGKLRLKVIRP